MGGDQHSGQNRSGPIAHNPISGAVSSAAPSSRAKTWNDGARERLRPFKDTVPDEVKAA